MAVRSYSDVPNRVVHLFLQEAGIRYDKSRGLVPFKRLSEIVEHFGSVCAYCGASDVPLVEEHVVARNRESVGLHAWGNVVPACIACNRLKSSRDWREFVHSISPVEAISAERIARIDAFRAHYRYDPSTRLLRQVVEALYKVADSQTRALIDFAVKASVAALEGLDGEPQAAISDPPLTLGTHAPMLG